MMDVIVRPKVKTSLNGDRSARYINEIAECRYLKSFPPTFLRGLHSFYCYFVKWLRHANRPNMKLKLYISSVASLKCSCTVNKP